MTARHTTAPCPNDNFDEDSAEEFGSLIDGSEIWPAPAGKERLGARLLAEGAVTEDQLRIALHEQKQSGALLGTLLVRLGFLKEETLASLLAARTGFATIDGDAIDADPALLAAWPKNVALRCRALPLEDRAGQLRVAMADPYDLVAMDEIRRAFPAFAALSPQVIEETPLLEAIERLYGPLGAVEDLLSEMEDGFASPARAEHPIVRLLDWVLEDAARRGASDIHLEPENSFIRLRYRVDGRLQEVRSLHKAHWPALSHRLKILAGMNIADQRSIQDGRFRRVIGGSEVDFRAALMPTSWGETIVIRLLDHKRGLLSLEELGFDAHNRAALDEILIRPEGLTLVTGPTGSGKTTTLYAILRALSATDVNIATLEEPVEYQLPLLRQTEIQEEIGLNFAAGVRGVLRMDPDVIFIGEIRDAETAQMALRASMTGHRVFSTLHCIDALGAITRFADLGVNPRLLMGNLSGLMAQRLVRKLCPKCKIWRKASADEALRLGADPKNPPKIAAAKGCASCNGSGTKGRIALAEVLPLTPEIDDLVAAEASRLTLLRAAQKAGFRRLRADGSARVLRGEISFADLCRAVDMRKGV
jgi:general secretion pathway protein E/type IV pilus assembly protein PilB